MSITFATDRRNLLRRALQASVIGAGFMVSPAAAQEIVRSTQNEPAPSLIPQHKISLEPVSSLRAPTSPMRESRMERTRIDAILDQNGQRFIGDLNMETLHKEIDIASLTKLATYFLAEKCLAQGTDFVGRPFTVGTQLRDGQALEEHIFQMMRRSNNQSAQMIAEQMCGSIPAYEERVNFEARQLGMANTHLINPSGLPGDQDYDGTASGNGYRGFSTLYDMGVLVCQIRAHGYNYARFTSWNAPSHIPSTNPLYRPQFIDFSRANNVDGLKTGTTRLGTHLIASVDHENNNFSPITIGHVPTREGGNQKAAVAQDLVINGLSLLNREREQRQILDQLQTPPLVPVTEIQLGDLPKLSI
ncbi:MAG: hypothetical protein AB7E85_00535 [Pseudobdellovibrionaceae bacterium]